MRMIISFLIVGLAASSALAQNAGPARGETHVLHIDGELFFPLGWYTPGTCTSADALGQSNRDAALHDIQTMRRHGYNTIMETTSADGRIIARAVDAGWYNWYGYTFTDVNGRQLFSGHPRPGVFVEGMRWLMDQAYGNDSDGRMFTIATVMAFVTPGYAGNPYGGGDVMECREYARFIESERSRNARTNPALAARIPRADCSNRNASRPFWEWNLRYVVQNLRDHPGLLGWYLWDEPEGVSYRHLFGLAEHIRPAAYSGPQSLPTPDLLRYVYNLVREFESEGRDADHQRHPIIVDIHSPNVFFSDRFSWSTEGELRSDWSSGPFDRHPDGGFHTPADILGQEASAYMAYTGGKDPLAPIAWYWDQNFVSRTSAMLDEVVRHDDLWAAITIAAQAQLPREGTFAISEPLRCEPNDELLSRLLNDRDLVWQLLTSVINGMRGYVYYSHALMPLSGEGSEQVVRSNRLIKQFSDAGFPRVLGTRRLSTAVQQIDVLELTDYYRSDPSFTGPADNYRPGRSENTVQISVAPAEYRVGRFGRTGSSRAYGQATYGAVVSPFPEHELLRTAYHRHAGADYLFISNAFDARIVVTVDLEAADGLQEGRFDLSRDGSFRWEARERSDGRLLRIAFEPYEARVFRIGHGG